MDDLDKIIRDNRHVYTGTLYTIKRKEYPPWKPSGLEGRYNGSGTNAYYFRTGPESAWREVLYHNPDANWKDYSIWGVSIKNGTFVDVGALEGTHYLRWYSKRRMSIFHQRPLPPEIPENKLADAFWFVRGHADRVHVFSRLICSIFYLLGFSLLVILVGQNFLYVWRVTF